MQSAFRITALFLLFFLLSCEEVATPVHIDNVAAAAAVETPEVLLEEEKDRGYSSSSIKSDWRYENDIIMKLYEEALESNQNLAALDKAISEMPQMLVDSSKQYKKYNQTNLNYYDVALRYANQINDSITKKATVKLFSNLEQQYKHSVSEFDTLTSALKLKTKELNDQLVLVKLFVTKPMMVNYQTNELPDIESLENLMKEYKRLLKSSEDYIK